MAAGILHQLSCVLLLLLLGVTSGRPSPSSEAEEVPFNLTVSSYNLNTTLHWDYNRMEITPYFCVEMQNISEMKWMVIETCQNISHHFCDISYEIKDPLTFYRFRVKALVGPNTSISATKDVMLSTVGVFGPPHLQVYTEEKTIVVDAFHPEVPSAYDLKSIIENGDLYYIVYYRNDSKEATDCDESACTATFSISDLDVYCFSAQAKSNHFLMTMEKSKEICIPVTEESSKQPVAIIIVATTVGCLAILVISFFIITRWTKARSLMPQSLSSFVRNMVSYAHMPTQQTPNYDSVSTSPIESPVEKKPYMDEKEKADTDEATDSASKESSDPGYHTSEVTESEQKMEESEADQSNSSSYFHTDSSTNGINPRDTPESEKDENTSEPAPKPPKPNSFGYDKPHFPKELIN